MNRTRGWVLVTMVAVAVVSRFAPHPDNVTPIAAIGLFCAATFASKRLAILAPMLALLVSDGLFQITYRAGWQGRPGFYAGQWVVYACTLATAAIGFGFLRRSKTALSVTAASLAGSVVFYLATNFACYHGEGSGYPQTWAGLGECYTLALPFFRNSLVGDLGYSWLLFGSLAMAEAKLPAMRRPSLELEVA